jgi:hypothetical protein
MLSIIDIKKTIKQHTADMDITDSVDYKISAPPRISCRPNTETIVKILTYLIKIMYVIKSIHIYVCFTAKFVANFLT